MIVVEREEAEEDQVLRDRVHRSSIAVMGDTKRQQNYSNIRIPVKTKAKYMSCTLIFAPLYYHFESCECDFKILKQYYVIISRV